MKHLLMLAVLMSPAAFQQSDSTMAFDVAAIRANASGTLSGFRGVKGRTYFATNQAVRRLIADAHRVPTERVLGGPTWIGAASTDLRFVGGERFDIVATLPEGAAAGHVPAMLRRLLAERFKLTAHTELRETPIYALVVARDDGRFGSQLRRATVDCDAAEAAGTDTRPPTSGQQALCVSEVGGAIIGRGQRISTLAARLAMFAGRPVIDRTGLTGGFDFDVRFPELTTPADARGGGPSNDGGSLFVAIQEQLGLKLVPASGPIEFVIVDAIERPTDN